MMQSTILFLASSGSGTLRTCVPRLKMAAAMWLYTESILRLESSLISNSSSGISTRACGDWAQCEVVVAQAHFRTLRSTFQRSWRSVTRSVIFCGFHSLGGGSGFILNTGLCRVQSARAHPHHQRTGPCRRVQPPRWAAH